MGKNPARNVMNYHLDIGSMLQLGRAHGFTAAVKELTTHYSNLGYLEYRQPPRGPRPTKAAVLLFPCDLVLRGGASDALSPFDLWPMSPFAILNLPGCSAERLKASPDSERLDLSTCVPARYGHSHRFQRILSVLHGTL